LWISPQKNKGHPQGEPVRENVRIIIERIAKKQRAPTRGARTEKNIRIIIVGIAKNHRNHEGSQT